MDARIMKTIGLGQTFTISDLNGGDVILYGNKLGIVIELNNDNNDIITLELNSKDLFNHVANDEDLLYVGHSKVYTNYFKEATNYYDATASKKEFKNTHAKLTNDMEYLVKAHKLGRYLL